MNNLVSLPNDTKLIIIEFLTIDDCFALQQVKRGFFNGVRASFWSRKVFEKHIQHPEKLLNILKCSDKDVPYYVPSFSEFGSFLNAQALWQGLVCNQKKAFNFFASITKNNQQAKDFVDRIYKILNDPSLPIPAMKRETQYLTTSSEFENFLTEIHFEVRPSLGSNDKDSLMLQNACEIIKETTSQSRRASLKTKKSELNRRSSRFFYKSAKRSCKAEKQAVMTTSQRRIKAGQNKENKRVRVEGFLGIQGIVKSHCKIIRNYLTSLTEDRIILKEYKRCWKEFTYSMIELNALMQPYEELLTYKDLPKYYKNGEMVAFWKPMIDSWLTEVYDKVGLKIKDSFEKLLLSTITKEVTDNHPRFQQSAQKIQDDSFDFESCCGDASSEKIVRLLKKSFIALSDISLCKSGVNILEWESASESQQPKIKLVNHMYPKIKILLEQTIEVYDRDSSRVRLSQTLRNIQNIFDEVFNEEVELQEHSDGKKVVSVEKNGMSESNDFNVIAGQYKIISKCKWENRLSQIYPGTENLVSC